MSWGESSPAYSRNDRIPVNPEISPAAGIANPESFRGNLQVAIPGQTLAAPRKLKFAATACEISGMEPRRPDVSHTNR